MIEVSLLYYGQPEELNSVLLQNLDIIEFREQTPELTGLYIVENKFGKEILRKLSLDFEDGGIDWLVYRYLSENEKAQLEGDTANRRIYVLLQNYVSSDYFFGLKLPDNASHFFITGQSETMKPISSVADLTKTKNIVVAKSVRKKISKQQEAPVPIPDFLAAVLKLALNPVDELKVISSNLMQSNRRITFRFVELIYFLHFLIFMAFTLSFNALKTIFIWKPIAAFGAARVTSIKGKFFLRHIGLMSFYKLWGLVVDTTQYAIRKKDQFVVTVYYQRLHRFYYKRIHSPANQFWINFGSPAYYGLRSAILTIIVVLEKTVYYSFVHKMFFKVISFAGYLRERFFSPVYFKVIHPLVLMLYRGLVYIFFYATVHKLYHRVLKPIVSFTFYKTVHSLYFKVLRPAISYVYFNTIHKFYYHVLVRFWYEVVREVIYYKILHRFYYQVLVKFWYEVVREIIYYKFLLRIYHIIMVWVFHRIWPWIKFNIFIRINHFFIYTVRHFILMAMFKSYGLIYDLWMLMFRITKLYLLYPFFKIYWFTSFQYTKRVKKFFV